MAELDVSAFMKIIPLLLLVLAYSAFAEDKIRIETVQPSQDPDSIRLGFLERQLGVSSTLWKCYVPQEYKVSFSLFRKGTAKPVLSFTTVGPAQTTIFLFTSIGGGDSSKNELTFGHRAQSQAKSKGFHIGPQEAWGVRRDSNINESSFHLFDFWVSDEHADPLFWCTVNIEKD